MAAKNRRTFELRLGKLGLILFIGGISLLLFSMFLLGTLVGKHMETYPERYSAGMAEQVYDRLFSTLPRGEQVSSSAESDPKSEAAGEEFDLTFYDVLGGKGGEKAGKTVADSTKDLPVKTRAPPQALMEKPALSALSEASTGGTTEIANFPVHGVEEDGGKKRSLPSPERREATESGVKASSAVSNGMAPDGGAIRAKGRFEVQVAAYQESPKAERLKEKLVSLGFASKVVMKELPGKGRWFRVTVGGFETREKATAAAGRIAGKIRGVECVVRVAK